MSEAKQSRPKGTQDFVPPDSERLRRAEEVFRRLAATYGFREIVTPTFEHTEVFVKSSGTGSDIVTKEMYSFKDRGDRDVTLRPEGTPGAVRAVLENQVRLPCRLYYVGPFFRYSRPQKGRYREFHQVGVEALGEASPEVDAEVILLGSEFFADLGIQDCTVFVNSIGCLTCRPPYREKLVAWLSARRAELCGECQTRLETNPMRVFDCKNESCRRAVADAPKPREHLCPDCAQHFTQVLAALNKHGLAHTINDRLVRGLDYYSRTTFEYVSASLGAQDSLGGGGRYDYLMREFGGPDTPAVGFALGLERTLLAAPAFPGSARRRLAYVVWLSAAELDAARSLVDRLRCEGVAARIDYDAGKVKNQFRSADAANAACCVIIGGDELAKGVYSLKDLTTGEQTEVPANTIGPAVRALFRD
jgi:histidyl-tRNA synthetase